MHPKVFEGCLESIGRCFRPSSIFESLKFLIFEFHII